MHLSQLYTNSHLTSKNLDGYLRLFSAVVSSARVELDPKRNVYVYEANVPCGPRVSTFASTENEALARLLTEVHSVLSTSFPPTAWPEAWQSLDSTKKTESVEQAKTRQSTVGVTSPLYLFEAIGSVGRGGETNFAETARHLATAGFEAFDDRIMEESPNEVLAELSNALIGWRTGPTKQWMLRLEPNVCTRLKLSAKEFGKSASEFSQMCIAYALLKRKSEVSAANDTASSSRRADNRELA